MIIFFKLILSHLLGDFLLQPDSWVRAKEKHKLKAWQLYAHTFIHFALPVLLILDVSFIKWAFLIALSHFITDFLKLFFQHDHSKRIWFFTDQAIHISVIIIIWFLSLNIETPPFSEINEFYFILITFIYALTQPVSAMIRFIISKWTPDTGDNDSLKNAGSYIGLLERLFVFTFIVTNNWEAIGFLLAAKSVFRFGDLKESKDRKLTEYVMIGTFISFGIALLAGIIFNHLFPK